MGDKLQDWKNDWIAANGETNELEVVVKNDEMEIYEGSFKDIPEELLDREVIDYSQIIASSMSERNGAYSLTILC